MAHAWLDRHGLMPAYRRVFDEEDFPRDVPGSYTALLAAVLPPAAMDKVQLAVAADHVPLSSVLRHTYSGRPRLPFSAAQLATGFEVFLPPASAERATAPIAGYGKSAQTASATTTATVPAAAAEDPRVRMMALPPAEIAALNARILAPFAARLHARTWDDWDVLGSRNPFTVKFTPGNAASLGVPKYFEVISASKAMDLVRIAERIAAGRYKHARDMLADVAQMLLNAKMFNKPDGAPLGAVFPPPERFEKHKMFGSVYRMAFELEAEVAAAAPELIATWDSAVYEAQRRIYDMHMTAMQPAAAAATSATAPPVPPMPPVVPPPLQPPPVAQAAAPPAPVVAAAEEPRKRPKLVFKV